jgi:hypothetical protein
MNDEAVDLAFIGMHQDDAAVATGVIGRMDAGDQDRRSAHIVSRCLLMERPSGGQLDFSRVSPRNQAGAQ